jgi:hypothetical protein
MLRGFIKPSKAMGVLGTTLLSSQDVDISGDVDLANVISEGETRNYAQGGAYILLRRAKELLFAMRQVELLERGRAEGSPKDGQRQVEDYVWWCRQGVQVCQRQMSSKIGNEKKIGKTRRVLRSGRAEWKSRKSSL